MFDDGDLNNETVKALKTFLDVSAGGLVWARWGASKLAKHLFRAIADNKVAANHEPT